MSGLRLPARLAHRADDLMSGRRLPASIPIVGNPMTGLRLPASLPIMPTIRGRDSA
jgi:hypothetical protein